MSFTGVYEGSIIGLSSYSEQLLGDASSTVLLQHQLDDEIQKAGFRV